MQLPTN